MKHKFKIGDRVVILSNYNDGTSPETAGESCTITGINPSFRYRGKNVIQIQLDHRWAEPHEIRHHTKLDKALK